MSKYFAVESIEEAFEDAKNIITPFNFVKFLKLMVVVLFISGTASGFLGNVVGSVFDGVSQTGMDQASIDLGPEVVSNSLNYGVNVLDQSVETLVGQDLAMQNFGGASIVAFILVFGLLIYLVWSVISNIMEFVFVDICSNKDISVLDKFGLHKVKGVKLLGFKILVYLLSLLVVGIGLGTIFLGLNNLTVLILSLVIGVPLVILGQLVLMFTTDFAIVQSFKEDKGILSSWNNLLTKIRANPLQSVLYIFLKWALIIGTGILKTVLGIFVMIPLLIILAVFGVITFGVLSVLPGLGIVIGVLLGLAVAILITLTFLALNVPFETFFRYYSIRVFEKLFEVSVVES